MRDRPALTYVLSSVCFGTIAVFASEHLFWSAPKAGNGPLDFVLTVLAYSLCAAAALSGALWSGLGGWRALFLGGAITGWLVEGALVATAYDAFPAQLVWTPLAWHALITALGVGGLARAGARWAVGAQLAALIALGAALGVFAQYWPLERGTMPPLRAVLAYLVGAGALVAACSLALDRLGPVPRSIGRPLWVAPALLALLWSARFAMAPSALRLSVPLLIAWTLWIMRRLSTRTSEAQSDALELGGRAPAWRHALFLALPLSTTVVSAVGWARVGGAHTNIPFALCSSALSLGLFARLSMQALRAAKPATPTG